SAGPPCNRLATVAERLRLAREGAGAIAAHGPDGTPKSPGPFARHFVSLPGVGQGVLVAARARQFGERFVGGFFLIKDFLQEAGGLGVAQEASPFVQAAI